MDDERLVELAHGKGWIDDAGLSRLRHEQQSLADRGVVRSLWLLAQDIGLISDERARDLRRSTSTTMVRALCVEGWMLSGRIGAGGMGDVFRAERPDGNHAAVKLLLSRFARDPEHLRRFAREARASLRLRHPHVVASLGAGAAEGSRYLIMELIGGPSLKARLLTGPLVIEDALVLLHQIAAGLAYANDQGVLHRDVKPANILLAPARPGVAEPFCAKICDFGLAKIRAATHESGDTPGDLTATGMALGTPHYMSPEQATGDHDLDCRSDMYALGATLFHAITGQTLFNGKSSAAIMYCQVTTPPDLALLTQIGVGHEVRDVIATMLAKRRNERFADWAAVLEALLQITPTVMAEQHAADAAYAGPPVSAKAFAEASDVFPAVPRRAPISVGDLAAPSAPTVLPSAPAAPTMRRRWAWITAAAATTAIAAIAVMALFAISGWAWPQRPIAVTPATVASWWGSDSRPGRHLLLAPGRYPELRCGPAQAGLTIEGSTGTVLSGLRLDPGAQSMVIRTLSIDVPLSATAATIAAGASITFDCVQITGGFGLAVDGSCSLTGGSIASQHTAVVATVASQVTLDRTVIQSHSDGITGDHSDLTIAHLRISAATTAITLTGGRLHLRQVELHGTTALAGHGEVEVNAITIVAPSPLMWSGSAPRGWPAP